MAKKLILIGKIYLYLVGAFFIVMAFDCFGDTGCVDCDTFWEHLLCFGISIVPGLIVILLNYFLRHQEQVLGILLIVLAVFAFFFFRFTREFVEKIPTFIIIVLLPLLIGTSFIYIHKKDV
jgi:hypothetical protein